MHPCKANDDILVSVLSIRTQVERKPTGDAIEWSCLGDVSLWDILLCLCLEDQYTCVGGPYEKTHTAMVGIVWNC